MQERGDHNREPWVSVDQVAEHLGVAKDTVYRWIETRGLPAAKIGRLWKCRLGIVDEWVEAGGAVPRVGYSESQGTGAK